MLYKNQHPNNKSITVSVLGLSNVGKSTLINSLMGEKLSIVTDKVQTTWNSFRCIFVKDRTEVILIDTPGINKTNKEFNKRLNQQARDHVNNDLNLLLIDLNRDIVDQLSEFYKVLDKKLGKTWIVFTKSDKVESIDYEYIEYIISESKKIIPEIETYIITSSFKKDSIDSLKDKICESAIDRPHRYTKGEMSNKNMRFFASEYVREQLFRSLKDEVPYETAVLIDEYKEFKGESHIKASIFVNRPSQRAIIIGSKGQMIKKIGINARENLEKLLQAKAHLNLHVKVVPGWLKNNKILEQLELYRAKDSRRVWRAR